MRPTTAPRRPLAALIALFVSLSLRTSVASACRCHFSPESRVTVPADGAVGFPTDGAVRVFLSGFPWAVRRALASEYRLLDPRGAEVPLDAAVAFTRLDLRPRAALQPRTRYTLQRLYAYDAAGNPASDHTRLGAANRQAAGLRLAWFSELGFETGDGPAPPRVVGPVELDEPWAYFGYGGGDCGPGLAAGLRFRLPAAAEPTDVMQLEMRGADATPVVIDTTSRAGTTSLGATDLACPSDPVHLPATGPLALRIVVLGVAGNTVGASRWAEIPRNPAQTLDEAHRLPTDDHPTELSRAWSSFPVVAPVVAPVVGPTACPYGFEAGRPRELVSPGDPWDSSSGRLVFDGTRGWISLQPRDHPAVAFGLTAQGDVSPQPTTPVSDGGSAVPGPDGSFDITTVYASDGAPSVTLGAFDRDGRTRWSRPLPEALEHGELTVGGGRLLATWTEHTERFESRLRWALFDARSGAPVGAAHTGRELIGDAWRAAWWGGRFGVAWMPNGDPDSDRTRLRVARLDASGAADAPRILGRPRDDGIALVAAGACVAMLTTRAGRMVWTLLGPDGSVVRGPVPVGAGTDDDRDHAVDASYRDGLFAVAWESSTGLTYVAAMDATGAVSSAYALAGPSPSSLVGVAASTAHTFLASYVTNESRAFVSELRCRATPPVGPPARIAP